jgi:hypothetical protein
LWPALRLLADFQVYAHDTQIDPWSFAVGLDELKQLGLHEGDLRWLALKGYIEHRTRPSPSDRPRSNRRSAALSPRSRFLLTPLGRAFVDQQLTGMVSHPPSGPLGRSDVPRWDPAQRTLFLGDEVAKCFRQPAANQERILAAFQRLGWPRRIANPLVESAGDCEPHERLHNAVKRLNSTRGPRLVVFARDGTGRGVTWSLGNGEKQ